MAGIAWFRRFAMYDSGLLVKCMARLDPKMESGSIMTEPSLDGLVELKGKMKTETKC